MGVLSRNWQVFVRTRISINAIVVSLPSLLRSESEEEEEELSLSFFGDDSGVAYSFEDGVLLGNETLLSFDPV